MKNIHDDLSLVDHGIYEARDLETDVFAQCYALVEVHATVGTNDWRPRNSYHQVCYVFAARAASAYHWSWSAVGDDQRLTEGDSRLQGTWEPLRQVLHQSAPNAVLTCDHDQWTDKQTDHTTCITAVSI